MFPKLTGGTTTLSTTTDRTIGSLNLAATAGIALDIPDGRTLHIDGGTANAGNVGGILISGSSATAIAASGTNHTGAVTVGMPNEPGELLVQQNSTAAALISASITDNGGTAYPVSLVKEGPGTLVLSGSNTYTGGTFVTEGVLDVTGADAIPSDTSLTVDPGCTFIFDPGLAVGNDSLALTRQAAYEALAAEIPPTSRNFTSVVPEPSTLALLAAGCVGLAVMAVQRRL